MSPTTDTILATAVLAVFAVAMVILAWRRDKRAEAEASAEWGETLDEAGAAQFLDLCEHPAAGLWGPLEDAQSYLDWTRSETDRYIALMRVNAALDILNSA